MKYIDIFTQEQLGEFLNEAKLLAKEIDGLYKEIDSVEYYDEESYETLDFKRKQLTKCMSSYRTVIELDKIFPNRKDRQYDVTKIYIHPETEELYKEYDFNIMKLIYPDMKKKTISKEISMFYLMSGFAVSDKDTGDKIRIQDDVLI